jgi:hypothetical protein
VRVLQLAAGAALVTSLFVVSPVLAADTGECVDFEPERYFQGFGKLDAGVAG